MCFHDVFTRRVLGLKIDAEEERSYIYIREYVQ